MQFILFIILSGWSVAIIFRSLFLPKIIENKIEKGDLLGAYDLSEFYYDLNLFGNLINSIEEEYEILRKCETYRLSRNELVELISYMGILQKPSSDFYHLIIEAKKRKDPFLLEKIRDNHTSASWKKQLEKELDKVEDAG